jgi:hypothetical protein
MPICSELIDTDDPATLAMRAEQPSPELLSMQQASAAFRSWLTWITENQTSSSIVRRVLISARMIDPSIVRSITLDGIAHIAGGNVGRTAVHKDVISFERLYGISCILRKSSASRMACRQSWRSKPDSSNP